MRGQKLSYKAAILALAVLILPVMLHAGVATSYDSPDTTYLSNVVIDIVEHNGGVWFATSEGVNFSFDDGETWLAYDNTNGLVSNSVSAIYSIPTSGGSSRVWVGTGHEEEFEGELYGLSDGLSFSDDNGDLWTQIIFDSTGLDIPYVWGVDRTVYDITGHYDEADPNDNWLFFALYAGGFLASNDGGMNWRRIYPSFVDSVQYSSTVEPPSLRNRYFSCVADTSHADSLFVWAGTAGGFFQYVFAPPREKPYSAYINDIVFCDNCGCDTCSDSNFVYFAGDTGITRGTKTGGPFISRFIEDGLPGAAAISAIDFGDKLFVGTIDPLDSSSTGLAESSDFGDSYSASTSFSETGANNRILDFTVMGDRLYMAAEEAGLYVTADTGTTWDHIFVDSSGQTPLNRRNVVNAVHAWGDTLLVGTDSGLVAIFMDVSGNFVTAGSRFTVPAENESSSTKIIGVETQTYQSNDVIWTINRPLSVSGTPIVGRSADFGFSFDAKQIGTLTNDLAFQNDTVFVVGEQGIYFSPDTSNPGFNDDWIVRIRETSNSIVVDSLLDDVITAIEILGDTIFIGTDNGYAVSLSRGAHYDIRRPNREALSADLVINYSLGIDGISGNFIPAMEVQYVEDTSARVWISNRPAESGTFGISVGRIDLATSYIFDENDVIIDSITASIYNWDDVYDDFAWNFAFYDDTVFAATDGGLIYARAGDLIAGDLAWDTLEFVDSAGFPLVLEGTPVYAVEVIGDYLWVGTGDRTIRISLDDFTDQQPSFVVDTADEVYAFPVPYSHSLDQELEFHFIVDEPAEITLEIYDFGMNLVRRVIDNQHYEAGIYPSAGLGRRTWDGLNGKGDEVAVGMYYFKIEYSTGEVRWGKLAVIP